MRVEKTVQIGDREVVVREMTLGEIRAWLKAASSVALVDTVDALLFEDFRPCDLKAMVSADVDLDAFTPSELRELLPACQEVNADFFALLAKAEQQGRQMLAEALSKQPSL
jgi:hypothetical protein